MKEKKILFIMGVSGCGKSSVGKKLSQLKTCSYIDADDHHPQNNINKMRRNIPLTDEDRAPWLKRLNLLATECLENEDSMVFACSCLKPEYRQILQHNIEESTVFIYLKGSFDVISERMKKRKGHYFTGDSMLKNQLETLVEPTADEFIDVIEVPIDDHDINGVVGLIMQRLGESDYV